MIPEEMERTMQFILNQQAQFASDIQQLKEVQAAQQAQFSSEIQESREAERTLREAERTLTEAETTLMRAMTTVVGMQGQTNDRVSRLETAVAEVAERVSAFIAALRDGKGKKRKGNS